MIQVLIVKEHETTDVTPAVENVEWSGASQKAVRKLTVAMVRPRDAELPSVPNGCGVLLRYGEEELFRGVVFHVDYKPGKLSFTCYDPLIYMTNNKDSYVFKGMKASAVLTKLCDDFAIPVGSVKDTGYVIPYLVCDEETLFDMAKKALAITYRQLGARYSLFSREGKLHLVPYKENARKWVLETGLNLIDYSYGESIEGAATKVKLQGGEGKQTLIATAENKSLQAQFGVLQHYEKVKEKHNRAQLQEAANRILAEKGKAKKTLRLDDALGLPDVVAGTAVVVNIPELEIERTFAVEEDTHRFQGRSHRMSLTLTEMT